MSAPPLYVVSGGQGISGEQLARTALAQFTDVDVPVIVVPGVREVSQIADAVNRAAQDNGTIVHTLVDAHLRQAMIDLARESNVVAIDLMGHLLARLAAVLGREPKGQPGLYRQLRQAYFDRMAAIEFAVTHDDGRNAQELPQAEIVLAGVSRVGKTPLSMYLSILGWRVANVPLVQGIDPPTELFEIDPRRAVGLMVEPEHLLNHRQRRQRRMGLADTGRYADPAQLHEEVEAARRLFRRAGFAILDVTDKPIEESADEVIAIVTRRLKE